MWPVVGAVLPQAMAIALSPVPMICIVLVLLSDRPVRAGLCFAAGWLGALTIAVGLVAWFTDTVAEGHEEGARDGVDVVQLAVGILFGILAVRYWRKRPAPGTSPPRPAVVDRIATMSGPGLVLTGAAAALANVKNLPLVLSAGSLLGGAALGTAESIVAVAIFIVAASLTVLGPLVAVVLTGPDRSARSLRSVEAWLLANLNTITVVLLAVLCAVLVGEGLDLFR
ncbi:GAP family protein [Kribbella sp. NBC_00709]|uniref:GAP family protein n=1 Tax=Kribbella sp. NBC_00709 TaxID=2975972 RepID=UPI002E294063|nr:GAP family protein [Kribbella sp. NBC_00709]